MDNFIKVTTGHVMQYYEKNQDGIFVCTGQDFTSDDDPCEYVDDGDCPIDPPEYEYQAYDMVQPSQDENENKTFCECCGRHDCTDVEWRKYAEEYECGECYRKWQEDQGWDVQSI